MENLFKKHWFEVNIIMIYDCNIFNEISVKKNGKPDFILIFMFSVFYENQIINQFYI